MAQLQPPLKKLIILPHRLGNKIIGLDIITEALTGGLANDDSTPCILFKG